ncbi:MAG TPA: 30S ribosomal protein S6 [Anaerolineae bacterium]|nr:MAG: 30S ribosomal protein S6 [Chloroflexi bacterium ADurb.Bin222]HOC20714.1 30S ribosomal protein S6 [Anaerolineae bacterium]HOS79118.1 30S ribosomal protein S6 [Anaerolineae bacterium]HQJ10752.1 30S ribosomal protein S6 [Anaerolineae bacterium]HQM14139.1 30S ribosomal protein S6 [Anaerolineae bacterium]
MVTRSYELMFIVSPELPEENLEALLNRVQTYLHEAGATVLEFRNWGTRRLAYAIKGFREGRYYLTRFNMSTDAVKDFERRLLLLEGVLRELLILVEDVPASEPEGVMPEFEVAAEEAPEPAAEFPGFAEDMPAEFDEAF